MTYFSELLIHELDSIEGSTDINLYSEKRYMVNLLLSVCVRGIKSTFY